MCVRACLALGFYLKDTYNNLNFKILSTARPYEFMHLPIRVYALTVYTVIGRVLNCIEI